MTYVIGLHPTQSNILWNTYLNILSLTYEKIDDDELKKKAKEQVINLLERTLKIPQNNIEEFYQRYVTLIGKLFIYL